MIRSRYEGFQVLIKAVGTGRRGSRDLTFAEARDAGRALLSGDVPDVQVGAFLIAMRMKGEVPEELAGIAQALREAATAVEVRPGRPLIACAGAYDGVAEAPHLSLAAAVAAAACGAGVVVHCGDRLGPKHGVTQADVLAALGGPRRPAVEESAAMLERSGVGVVHAARALPGWERLARLRDAVGLRGPLHSAEKLVDYAGARRFVIGHTHASYTTALLGALGALGADRAVAVRGLEGSDVARPGRPSAFEGATRLDLPERLGEVIREDGGADASAAITRGVLAGEVNGTLRYTVTLNAGLRLYAAGLARDTVAGAADADAAIADGRAAATLDALVG